MLSSDINDLISHVELDRFIVPGNISLLMFLLLLQLALPSQHRQREEQPLNPLTLLTPLGVCLTLSLYCPENLLYYIPLQGMRSRNAWGRQIMTYV